MRPRSMRAGTAPFSAPAAYEDYFPLPRSPRRHCGARAAAASPGGVVWAPAESTFPARLIRPDEVRVEMRGKGVTERRIHWILSEKDPAARLLLVEVLTPAGHWSTYPPHKHDEDTPGVERALEELYYYRFNPEQGFAFLGIYTKPPPQLSSTSPSPLAGEGRGGGSPLNVSIRARHDDLVLVPRGYHVVSAAPGYDCYYLNAMAGVGRWWVFPTAPDPPWVM